MNLHPDRAGLTKQVLKLVLELNLENYYLFHIL